MNQKKQLFLQKKLKFRDMKKKTLKSAESLDCDNEEH